MITNDKLATFRAYVGEAFKAGTSTFPHYTLHGQEHLDELDRLALLIGTAIALPTVLFRFFEHSMIPETKAPLGGVVVARA